MSTELRGSKSNDILILIDQLSNTDGNVRVSAGLALAELADDKDLHGLISIHTPALIELQKDEDHGVQFAAGLTLAKLAGHKGLIFPHRITELAKTRAPGPVGQFRVRPVKPLVPCMAMPYLWAQRILHLARNVDVFHMQSIYLARQALHLVILLNDLIDPDEGPEGEGHEERINMEDELIVLMDAMKEWGAAPKEGTQLDYDIRLRDISESHGSLFQERFYFHDTRIPSEDVIYQKLVDYDQRTIKLRNWNDDPGSTSGEFNVAALDSFNQVETPAHDSHFTSTAVLPTAADSTGTTQTWASRPLGQLKPHLADPLKIVQNFTDRHPEYNLRYDFIEEGEKHERRFQFLYKMDERILARGPFMTNKQAAKRCAAHLMANVLRSEGFRL